MLIHLRSERQIDLGDLCYTLQVGREAMEERLATVVSGVDELIDRLEDWIETAELQPNIYRGSPGPRGGDRSGLWRL